MTQSELTCNMA